MSLYLTCVISALIFFVFVAFLLRKGSVKEGFAILWLGSAGAVLLLAIFPGIAQSLSRLAGIELASNLIFFVAILLLVTVSLVVTHEIGNLQQKVQILTQEVAILRNKIEDK